MSMAASPPVSKPATSLGAIIVMGVSGCGKSSLGSALAHRLGCSFIEGDDLHPQCNVAKMSRGVALDDADRWPWLDALGEQIAFHAGSSVVLSCSALRRTYRDRLRHSTQGPVTFVFLQGSRTALQARLEQRRGHYMPAQLLDSQLATLELPTSEPDVVTIDIEQPIESVVTSVLSTLASRSR
jgi:gluconokinase